MKPISKFFLCLWCGPTLLPAAAQDAGLNRRDATPADLRMALPPAAALAERRSAAAVAVAGADDTQLYGEQEILIRPDLWQPWSVSASIGGEWQSNAPLAAEGEASDYVLRQSPNLRNT